MDNINNIKIHQAYFGEVNRSHSCIDIELDDTELKSFLTSFTDRPGAIPIGISLKPYISGTSFSNYYILTKTFSDENSSRSGMVFTHVLIIDLKDFLLIKNLKRLFELFVLEIPYVKTISVLKEISSIEEEVSCLLPAYIKETASALLDNKTPVIFCGELPAFEETLAKIWLGLPIGLRKILKFRVSFTPNDIETSKDLLLVYVQDNLISKWNGIEIINSENRQLTKIISPSIKLLVGQITDNPILDFIEKLNIDLIEFDLIGMCDRAFTIYSKIEEADSDSIIQLIRLLSKLSPDQNDGKAIKSEVLKKFTDLLISGKHWNLKSFRNISFKAFQNGELLISKSMTSFIEAVFKSSKKINLEIVSEWINLTSSSQKKTDYWHKTVSEALNSVMSSKKEESIKSAWKLINSSSIVTNNIVTFIPGKEVYQEIFREYLPSDLNIESAKVLSDITKKRKWFLLHADSTLIYNSLSNSVLQQIDLEKEVTFDDSKGLKYLCEKLTESELIELTLSNKDSKLIRFLGEKSISNSNLLSSIDLSNSEWLKIWAISLKSTKNIEYANVITTKDDVNTIFNHLVVGNKIPHIILELLSKSEYANLFNSLNVSLILDNLPSEHIDLFVEASTFGYIDNLFVEKTIKTLDNRIEGKLISSVFTQKIIDKYSNNILAIILICENHTSFSKNNLDGYISRYNSSITLDEAKRLGIIVTKNSLKSTAAIISSKTSTNNNWKYAVNECLDLLDFFTRIKYRKFGKSEKLNVDDNEWWINIEQIIIYLYPNGNSITTIWRRSGGEEASIPINGSSSEIWNNLLNNLKNNRFEKITMNGLLKEINKQYGNDNEKFKILFNIRQSFINN